MPALRSPKKPKKSLAMPTGIDTNGVILRVLGEYMRKFKRFPPRTLRFRSLLILAGAFALLAAFAPCANAALIAYFNFEGPADPPFPVDMTSNPPGAVITQLQTNYFAPSMSAGPGIPLNVAPGDVEPNITSMGLRRSNLNDPANFDIPLFTSQGFFQNMTVTFATNRNGNGFANVQLFFSTNGGVTFTPVGVATILPTAQILVTLPVPAAANNAPLLVLRIQFTLGQSNGNDLQTIVDNIQINGTIVPEPATIAGGLLGVLGLCWHQRRRLIRCVRLRRA
jgi:hypothetical protein